MCCPWNAECDLVESYLRKDDVFQSYCLEGFKRMRPVLNLAGFTYSYLHYTHVAFSRPLEGRGTICLACRGLTRNPLRVAILFRSPKIVFKRRQKTRFPRVAPIGRSLHFAFVLIRFLLLSSTLLWLSNSYIFKDYSNLTHLDSVSNIRTIHVCI